MPDPEVTVGEITETLKRIKSNHKKLSPPELGKARRYIGAAWDQLWPSYQVGGHENLAEREALQLVIDLQMLLKTELDVRKAAAGT